MVLVERVTREADCYCTDHLGNVVRPDSLVYHGHAVLASVVFSYHLLAECTSLAQKITNYTDSNVQAIHAHAQCSIIQRDAIHLSFFFFIYRKVKNPVLQSYNIHAQSQHAETIWNWKRVRWVHSIESVLERDLTL